MDVLVTKRVEREQRTRKATDARRNNKRRDDRDDRQPVPSFGGVEGDHPDRGEIRSKGLR